MTIFSPLIHGRSLAIDRTSVYGEPADVFKRAPARAEDVGSTSDPIVDQLTLSPEAKERLAGFSAGPSADKPEIDSSDAIDDNADKPGDALGKNGVSNLSPEEEEQVQKLADRDREVRTHEQAHLAAAGPYAKGGPTYSYQKGPDGRNYAIGGEVQIDTAPVSGDPEATIQKARIVKAAALAPAEPSSQDQAVAAAATQMEMQARAEQALQRLEQQNPEEKDTTTGGDAKKRSLDFLA